MWEAMAAEIESLGGEVRRSDPVTGLRTDRTGSSPSTRAREGWASPAVISSLPLGGVAAALRPRAPREVIEAARGLRHRDFLTVALVIEGADPFPDNWVYVHDPGVRVGRVQNFRAWSPWMTPTRGTPASASSTSASRETSSGTPDAGWSSWRAAELGGSGSRTRTASPGVGGAGAEGLPDLRRRLRRPRHALRSCLEGISNLQQVGRNGLHRYNNSDHSMLTALRAVENLCEGSNHDVWEVNADSLYHERAEPEQSPYRAAPETPAMGRPLADDAAA